MGHRNHLRYWSICKQLMRTIAVTEGVLGCKKSFSCRSVPLALGIFLERVRHRDWSITQILPVHCIQCCIRSVEASKVDKSEALAVSGLWISHNFRSLQNDTECAEGVVQQFFVDFWIEITDENVCPDIKILLMGRSFVDSNGFSVQLNHVHNLDGIVGIFFPEKLHETVALVHLGDTVLRLMNIYNWAGLHEELPQQCFSHFFVQSADINRRV